MELSLLDRLTENNTGPGNRYHDSRLVKQGLLRDLGALLNTRRAEQDVDARFEQATTSVLTFGVVDFTSYNLNSVIDQERVRCSVERAIRQFEPRLARVSVTLEQPSLLNPVLNLRIEALLRTGAVGDAVTFEATLHRASRRIVFAGSAG